MRLGAHPSLELAFGVEFHCFRIRRFVGVYLVLFWSNWTHTGRSEFIVPDFVINLDVLYFIVSLVWIRTI